MNTQPVSDKADARWRPKLHFTAKHGFINDPNGLIFIDGRHHAFYQHNPHDSVHGPMHWGHAVSDDLVHWQELPIALYPDALGQCFSGSAVATPDDEVALLYTAHLENDGEEPLQTQCLVYANRALTHFRSAPNNPVLANPGLIKDFRDPKVFWHAPSEAWIMLITHGRHVGIYRSSDLLDWTLASEFGHTSGAPGEDLWECPDLVEVPVAGGGTRWTFIVGVWAGAPGGGSGTQYFPGEFDGYLFQPDGQDTDVHWFDHGRDCYAAQSFAGRDTLAPRVIAWFSNWQYANHTPTSGFRGSFTLPRDLYLTDTPAGYKLKQCIPDTVRDAFLLLENDGIPPVAVFRISRRVLLEPAQCIEIHLFGDTTPQFIIERSSNGHHWLLHLYRDAVLGNGKTLTSFNSASIIELSVPTDENLELELFVDHGLIELFIGGGLDVATMCFYPENPAGKVSVVQRACLSQD